MVRNAWQYFLFKQGLSRIFAPVVFDTALFYQSDYGAKQIFYYE